MGFADLDYCDLHVTIKNYFTSALYVDTATGITSADLPYEKCEVSLEAYEPKKSDFSTAQITFPSLIARPELRGILQSCLVDGARVEIYAFQPDAGDPYFAGYIPPGGITEQNGNVVVDVHCTVGRGKWWHIRRGEEFNQPVTDFYTRGMGHWVDIVNEDFSNNPASRWNIATFGTGVSGFDNNDFYMYATADYTSYRTQLGSKAQISPSPGDYYLIEFDAKVVSDFHAGDIHLGTGAVQWIYNIGLYDAATVLASPIYQIAAETDYDVNSSESSPQQYQLRRFIQTHLAFYGDYISPMKQGAPVDESGGNHFLLFVRFYANGTASLNLYRNNIFIASSTFPWAIAGDPGFPATPMVLGMFLYSTHANTRISVSGVRWRQLVPYLNRAARFVPQTIDATYYQANQDDNLSFLNLFVEKDSAEYRPIYRSAPQSDELELDAYSTLGSDVSSTLGYSQPGARGGQAQKVAPFAAVTDVARFAGDNYPFRFEEGYNLSKVPGRPTPALAHGNEVIRMGSSQLDAQVFSDVYSIQEVGGSGNPATYPYFETVSNDDRVGLITFNKILARQELVRRLDPTPSLDIAYNEQAEFAFKWREMDTVFVRTKSLLNNVEGKYRVAKLKLEAGNPERTVTVGRLDFTPDMLRDLLESMNQTWLFEQSGASGTVYPYPNVPIAIPAGTTSAAYTITLDAVTTGTQITYAALHWILAESPISEVQALVNSSRVLAVNSSGNDSGLSICTGIFPTAGQYTIQFKNTGAGTHNLVGAFLVIRIKM